jgi:hypothetical protein
LRFDEITESFEDSQSLEPLLNSISIGQNKTVDIVRKYLEPDDQQSKIINLMLQQRQKAIEIKGAKVVEY